MVKICGITRREDAVAAAEAGASAIGFVFAVSSPRVVSAKQAAELGRGLEIPKVGVFTDTPGAEILAIAERAGLDAAQVYRDPGALTLPLWRAYRVREAIPELDADADAIVLDGSANGVRFDWRLAAALPRQRIVLAGGLNAGNVGEAIRAATPWGVDVSSGVETSPGVKDARKILEFVKAAREAAATL
ncbi:MAG: phosphoribosylanthranilate isomerase [Bryobacteraceae bacterium]|nr:phosphoribosylanthranilate isomerase [Bryobacteraceae bacterium]